MNRETIVPAIPDIRSDNQADVLRAIKSTLDVREARIGDPLDQLVTLRDLSDIGVVAGGGSSKLTSGALIPVVVPGVLNGYNPAADYTVPPPPTGLMAAATFSNVYLSWDGAPYRNHAYTEIWRAGSDNIGQAVRVGTTAASVYSDAAQEGQTYYYWIRFVSVADITGPYNSTAGTPATTATNPSVVLALLTGQITESQLYASLNTRINLIDADATVQGSVANRLSAVQTTVESRISAVQAQVNDIIATPTYSNTHTYATNELVTYNGAIYRAKQATTGNLPTDTTYWELIGNYSSLGQAVAANTSQLSTVVSDLAAEVSARTSLATAVNDPTTGLAATRSSLTTNYYTKSQADSAIAASATTLTSNFNNTLAGYATNAKLTTDYYTKTATDSAITAATTNLVSNTALATALANYTTTATLTSQYYTKTQADSAISNATLNLVSTTALNTALAGYATTGSLSSYVTNASLTANYYTKTNTDSAISNATQNLVSTTGLATTLASYPTTATLTTNYYTKTATDSAISSATQNLVSTNALNTALGNYTTTAALTQNYYTKTQTDSAISTATSTLVSQTGLNNSLANYTTTALLQQNYYTKTDTTTAISSASQTLQSQFNNQLTGYATNVALQQEATTRSQTDGTLLAQYTVKIDNNGHVSGFGLASSSANGTPTSAFIVRADRFAIAGPNDTSDPLGTLNPSRLPFIVTTSSTVVNGKTYPAGTWIDTAFIATATIGTAQISDLTADKITAGTLTASVGISTGKIYGGVNTSYSPGSANFGTGFFLGLDSSAYKFYVGSPTQNMLWDGNNLTVKGVVYASAGSFTGSIYASSGLIGRNIIDANGISSPNYVNGSMGWSVNKDGGAEFNNVTVRGNIFATSGSVGGNTINSSSVSSPNYAAGSAGWQLRSDGYAEFSNVKVRGDVQANSITANTVNTDNIVGNAVTTTYAGSTTGNVVSSTFSVPAGTAAIIILVGVGAGTWTGGGESGYYTPAYGDLVVDGATVVSASAGSIVWTVANPTVGVHVITAYRSNFSGVMNMAILVNKR